MSQESSTYQDLKLKINNKEMDSMRDEEQGPDRLGATEVNTDIDLSSIERALQDLLEQEIENDQNMYELYEGLCDEEVRDAENTIEVNEILEIFNNMDDEELDEYYNDVPDCFRENC